MPSVLNIFPMCQLFEYNPSMSSCWNIFLWRNCLNISLAWYFFNTSLACHLFECNLVVSIVWIYLRHVISVWIYSCRVNCLNISPACQLFKYPRSIICFNISPFMSTVWIYPCRVNCLNISSACQLFEYIPSVSSVWIYPQHVNCLNIFPACQLFE